MGSVYTIDTSIILLAFSKPIIGLFTSDKEVIEFRKITILYFCPLYIRVSLLYLLAGAVRGAGKGVPPMIILLTSMCLFRIIWMKLVVPCFDSIDIVLVLYPVSWFVGLVMMIIYIIKGKWLNLNKKS